ncbi:MAG: YqhA family protein, partial [Pirellulales bacterium]
NSTAEVFSAVAHAGDFGVIAPPPGLDWAAALQRKNDIVGRLHNGLTGLTFLYFAYGIYALFLTTSETMAEAPRWLKVENIAALKKTLLEVVAVLLAVMFVRVLAEKMLTDGPRWEMLIMPAGIIAIAISSRLMFSQPSQPTTMLERPEK